MRITCPTCRSMLDAPEEFLGRQVQCSRCQKVFVAQFEGTGSPLPMAIPLDSPGEIPPSRPWEPAPYGGPHSGAMREREPETFDDTGARRTAARAGLLLIINAIFSLLTMMILMVALALLPSSGRHDNDVGRTVCLSVTLLVMYFPGFFFNLFGGLMLRRLHHKGLAITGIVFAYVQAVLVVFALLVITTLMVAARNPNVNRFGEDVLPPYCFCWVLLFSNLVSNSVAAITASAALMQRDVQQAMDRARRHVIH